MTAFRIALLATAVAVPAIAVAQQMDHSTMSMPGMEAQPEAEGAPPRTPSADPMAGHDMSTMEDPAPPAAAPAADPMAGHDMSTMGGAAAPAADPMAGHDMSTMGGAAAPAADPMAGHDMSTMGGAAGSAAAGPMAGHDMSSMGGMSGAEREMPNAPPPPAALSGPAHAADLVYGPLDMAEAREDLRHENGDLRAYMVMVDQLEMRMRGGEDGYLWDAQGWYGGDLNKLWIKTEGEGTLGETPEDAEVQALWSRAITPWFDFQAGVRYDFLPDDAERSHFVLGLQGLVPYFFEIDAAAFLSDEGDVTARFEAEYDQLITQKLILQPRVEFEFAAQDIPELDIGRGVSSLETELRLRYEFVPEFAPYIGVGYERQMGKTADFARAAGEDVGGWSALVGLRTWF